MFMPWIGYFDIMARSDIFIVLDNVQYTTADWRNRNRIKIADSITWLTVPVHAREHFEKKINEIRIDNDSPWKKKHLASLEHSYKRAAFYDEIMHLLRGAYGTDHTFLVDLNMDLMRCVRQYLSLDTRVMMSSEMASSGRSDERVLALCKEAGATHYLSGPSAKSYIRESAFEDAGVEIMWHDYSHPYYNQLWVKRQGFVSHLSVVDLMFNHGPESLDILTGKIRIERPDWVKISDANGVERTAAEGVL